MKRHLKLIAAVVFVLFVVSGFSPAKSSGGSSGGGKSRSSSGGGSGGGCSSNKSKSHNSTDYDYDDDDYADDDYGSSGGTAGHAPTPTASDAPTATLVSCASRFRKEARVKVESATAFQDEYRVTVTFYGKRGVRVDSATETFGLPGNGTVTVDVPMDRPSRARKVKRCAITALTAA